MRHAIDGTLHERQQDPSWRALEGDRYLRPTPAQSETLTAVVAAVNVISEAIGQLPVTVMRDREAVEDHPLLRLVGRGPNARQTWPEWVEWYLGQALIYGNGLSEIVRRADGAVTTLDPIPWPTVTVHRLRDGMLRYEVVGTTVSTVVASGAPAATERRAILAAEVLHIRDRSDDGMVGRSRLARCAAAIALGISEQTAAQAVWRQGMFPSGAIQVPGRLAADRKTELREQIEQQFVGAEQQARVLILDQQSAWQTLSMRPVDAQMLESRRHAVIEVARAFNVPPPILQDYSHNTFTNAEQAGRWFAQFTLAPWVRKLEATLSQLLPRAMSVQFDMSGLLRSDHGERWSAYDIGLRNGVLTPNDVRRAEGLDELPGGDEPFEQHRAAP